MKLVVVHMTEMHLLFTVLMTEKDFFFMEKDKNGYCPAHFTKIAVSTFVLNYFGHDLTVVATNKDPVSHDDILENDVVTIYADFRNEKEKYLYFQVNDKWVYTPNKTPKEKHAMKLPNCIVIEDKIIQNVDKWYPTVHIGDEFSTVEISFEKDPYLLFE